MMPPRYRVYALRYARHSGRSEAANLIGGDPHSGARPLDYYIWAICSEQRTVVVDTGFSAAEARQRGREFLCCPGELLSRIGIAADQVDDVVLTHLHYDHAGNQELFVKARFHIQDRELAFATGRAMTHAFLRNALEVRHVTSLVQKVYGDRVVFHDGTASIAPGIDVHCLGGHTAGLQVVRITNPERCIVLASDAAHLYDNLEGHPFPIVVDVLAMLEGHRRVRALAGVDGIVVPGHDPRVLERFPPPRPELAGQVARLDELGQ